MKPEWLHCPLSSASVTLADTRSNQHCYFFSKHRVCFLVCVLFCLLDSLKDLSAERVKNTVNSLSSHFFVLDLHTFFPLYRFFGNASHCKRQPIV